MARRDRVLVAIVVAGGVAFAVPELMRIERFTLGTVISAMMQAIAVAAIGAYVGARRDLVASLRERAERAEEERELRADQAKASERARIAREMHDVLAHKVSLIALHAGALEVNADAGADRVEEAASLIRTTAHQTLEELREVLGVLRSEAGAEGADLVPTATVADIARLVDASRTAGITVDTHVGRLSRRLGWTRHADPVKVERVLMKLVVDPATDRVVGLHMVGADAGEIVQGFAVALRAGATKAIFDSTIGIHPTAAEEFVTMREPVRKAAGT